MIQTTAAIRCTSKTPKCSAFLMVVAFLAAFTLSGCMTGRSMLAMRQRDPMAGAPRLRDANNPRLEDLVAHLNKNTDRIQGWRANNVTIHADKWSLSGKLAVEKGRHVRLVVSSPRGNEVDMGSNDDRFWVWSRSMEPAFVTCKHENMEMARQSLGVPFEPDWLMEVLGVSPLPTSGVTMDPDPTNPQHIRLVQQVMSAHGQPLRRVVLVDLKKGNGVVVEHSLYDYFGKRIAVAKLSGHRLDNETGIVLPHRVMLDWPQNRMQMAMDLGKIQINPKSIPSQIWAMPELPGYEVVHLDSDSSVTRIASGVRLGPIDTRQSDDGQAEESSEDETDTKSTASFAGHSRISDDSVEGDNAPPARDDDWSE